MKKDKLKRGLSIALAAVMVVGTMTFSPQGASEVQAAPATVKDVNLGTEGIGSPTSTDSSATAWTGSKVYFGLEDSKNLWRVLDPSTGLLFADGVNEQRQFSSTGTDSWADCVLKAYLNGDGYRTNSNKFTTLEQNAITSNEEGDMRIPTIADVQNTSYGFSNNDTRAESNCSFWWLRDPGANNAGVISTVAGTGIIYPNSTYSINPGFVRPVFNLDLDSVLFTSASGASKASFATVGDSHVADNTWKLTLKDKNTGFAAKRLDAGNLSAGTTVKVKVSSLGTAGTGVTYNTISGMLTDADGTVLCYGKAKEAFGTGTGDYTFDIPAGVTGGAKFYVFAEDVHGATLTDYASNMVEPIYTAPPTQPTTAKPTPTQPTTAKPTTAKPTTTKPKTPSVVRPKTTTAILLLKASGGKKKIKLKWTKVKNATGYDVFRSRCGKKKYRKIKSVKRKTSSTVTKLKKARAYKFFVKAYKTVNGKKYYLKKSNKAHAVTVNGKRTNAKKVSTNFTKATLKKGKTKKIRGKVVRMKKGKKLLHHVATLRYYVSNKKVVKVSSHGKIKAIGKGKSYIYVCANNGVYKRLTIKVK